MQVHQTIGHAQQNGVLDGERDGGVILQVAGEGRIHQLHDQGGLAGAGVEVYADHLHYVAMLQVRHAATLLLEALGNGCRVSRRHVSFVE